jgi:hypothetical protein
MKTKTQSLRHHAKHIDKKLQRRLRVYFILSAILLVVLAVNMVRHQLGLVYGLSGLLSGLVLGIISSRMFRLSWDKDAARVVSRFDAFGIGVLVVYVLIEVFRNSIISYFTHGDQVTTTGLAVLAGIMIGRGLGTRGRIMQLLKEQGVFGR